MIEQPEFLERLVVEGGLRQISVHVDMTQAGRHGYPIGRIKCEADLHPVRQAFTDLALRIREKTGCILEYALSFTVTRRNIDDVPEVIRWYLADPKRSYIWRMLSFQPEADTGRTLFSQNPITPADVWEKICQGVGMPLRRDVSIFGHPDCNSWASLLVARPSGKYFPLLPDDPKFDHLLGEVLKKIGLRSVRSIAFSVDDQENCRERYAGRMLGLTAQQVMDGAHFLSAGVVSFARGLNDTPKDKVEERSQDDRKQRT